MARFTHYSLFWTLVRNIGHCETLV